MPRPGVVGARVEGRQRRDERRRRKVEVPPAARRAQADVFDQLGRGAHGVPVDAVLARHHDAALKRRGAYQNFAQQLGLPRIVGVREHGRPDCGVKAFLVSERVIFAEEGERVLARQVLDIFRERLSGDADGLDFVPRVFKR